MLRFCERKAKSFGLPSAGNSSDATDKSAKGDARKSRASFSTRPGINGCSQVGGHRAGYREWLSRQVRREYGWIFLRRRENIFYNKTFVSPSPSYPREEKDKNSQKHPRNLLETNELQTRFDTLVTDWLSIDNNSPSSLNYIRPCLNYIRPCQENIATCTDNIEA